MSIQETLMRLLQNSPIDSPDWVQELRHKDEEAGVRLQARIVGEYGKLAERAGVPPEQIRESIDEEGIVETLRMVNFMESTQRIFNRPIREEAAQKALEVLCPETDREDIGH